MARSPSAAHGPRPASWFSGSDLSIDAAVPVDHPGRASPTPRYRTSRVRTWPISDRPGFRTSVEIPDDSRHTIPMASIIWIDRTQGGASLRVLGGLLELLRGGVPTHAFARASLGYLLAWLRASR